MPARNPPSTQWLSLIDQPADLKAFSPRMLEELAAELRARLVKLVDQTGGHLSANLGVVELTLALHRVFNTPDDILIWDVGHQAYIHKMLTGRLHAMDNVRQRGGPCGFTRRSESEYDPFGAGHSSTSISAALGFALADLRRCGPQNTRRHIAVIGDGALTAGQAFEALNHAGETQANLLVIINDNEMSISPNVGALARHLTRLRTNPVVERLRQTGSALFAQSGELGAIFAQSRQGVREGLQQMLAMPTLFESLGLRYFGPVDGHDLPELLSTLENIRQMSGPVVLHVATQKGKGLSVAEADPVGFHGVAKNSLSQSTTSRPEPMVSFTQAVGEQLCHYAANDPELTVITPAMIEGSGLKAFYKRFPEQLIDVGIAEQHALTLAGGLAAAGIPTFVAIYSTFLQRAFDQLIHDLAIQKLPVVLLVDRAGLTGADGATHAGSFDLAMAASIPNITLLAPADTTELKAAMDTGYQYAAQAQPTGPILIRYPKDRCLTIDAPMPDSLDRPRIINSASNPERSVLVIAIGSLAAELSTAELPDITLVSLLQVKPFNQAAINPLISQHAQTIIIEEGATAGGIGAQISAQFNAGAQLSKRIRLWGIIDAFIEHGSRVEARADCELDFDTLVANIYAIFQQVSS